MHGHVADWSVHYCPNIQVYIRPSRIEEVKVEQDPGEIFSTSVEEVPDHSVRSSTPDTHWIMSQ